MEIVKLGWITAIGHWLRRYSRSVSVILIVGIFGFLVWRLGRDWHNLPPGFFSNVDYALLLASLVTLIPAWLLVSLRWGLTLRVMNIPIGWWASIRIWFLSQSGRYLPGGVWSYVARFYLSRSGIAREAIIASMVLETGLRVVSEVLVFLFSLPFWADTGFLGVESVLVLVGGVGLGLVLLHPTLLERFSGMTLLRRVGLSAIDLSGLRYCNVLVLLIYYIMTVVVVGGSFYLLVVALYPVPLRLFPALTGSLAASMVFGFLVPLAPNGLGVREGILAFLLGQVMPSSVAIVISVASRIWLSLGEAAWILVAVRLQVGSKPE